ncbi:hypothetical protein Scep_017591 [Stephania cephalantha]|uniref:glutathione transferase n=1 Tax=Stephania cephalantha TaxID=152367 RepID=A0AAP0NUD3_9MAGN
MAASDVKLVGAWVSPFVTRPRIALNLKAVEYEFLEEVIGTKSELLLKSNPVYKKIPVLLHRDRPICESLIILEYIDDTWTSGPSILPSDPYDRAIARFWGCYIEDKIFPNLGRIATSWGRDVEAIEQIKTAIEMLEKAFKDCSKGNDFFNGDQIGYLDIALGCHLGWLRALETMHGFKAMDEEKTPGLAGWAERFLAHEAVKDVDPKVGRLIEFAHEGFSSPSRTNRRACGRRFPSSSLPLRPSMQNREGERRRRAIGRGRGGPSREEDEQNRREVD